MKKLRIILIAFLISLSICAFASMQVKAQGAGADQFVFNTISSPPTAGTPFTITITAEVPVFPGSPDTTYRGTPTLSVSTGTISPSITPAFLNGVWTGLVTVTGAGSSVTITAIDGGDSGSTSFKVNPGVLNHFTLSTPGSVTAGSSFGSVTVTAYDTNGNVKTDYTGSIYFTSSDSVATLPYNSSSKYAFNSGDNGAHMFSVFILKTTPSQTLTVTDGSIITSSSSIIVNAGALDHFDFSTITTPQTAGTAITGITITAKDSYGNTVTSYASSTILTETDGGAGGSVTQSPVTFANGVWSGSLTLTKSGSGVTITASGGSQSGKSNSLTVNAGALATVTVSGPASVTAGGTATFAAIGNDSQGNSLGVQTATWSITTGAAGSWSGNAYTSHSVGSWTVSAVVSGITGTASLTVNAGALDHFVFNTIASQTAGSAFSTTITAKDSNDNTVMSYTGTNALTVSSGTISPTSSTTFASGVWAGQVTLPQSGTGISISTSGGGKSGTSNSFAVAPGVATYLAVSSGTSQVAGTPFSITVTAKDANGNSATGYIGTVHFSSSDSGASVSLPSNYAFQSGDLGTHTFTDGVKLMTVGTQSVTATDTAAGSITGSQAGITVKVSSGIHFVVTGFPNPAIAGSAGTVTVTVKDQYGNLFSGYAGTVKITSSDSSAVLPANAALTSGVGSFTVTLKTAGSQSITATDTVTSTINGLQTGITVNHAVAAANAVISPSGSSVTSGASTTFSSMASDTYGNKWDVTALTSWSISSGAGGSWSSSVFTSAAVGSWTVTGTYASTAYTTGLTVNPAGLDHFVFNFVGDQSAGSAFSVTVIAKDLYGNNVTDYIGTPSLTVSAGSISPGIMNAFVNGVGSTLVTVNTAGSAVIITVADGSISGVSNSFAVTNSPTPTPTQAPNSTPTPTPTSNPKNTPTATPSPSPPPLATVPVKTDSGSIVELAITGNITTSQISNATITSNQSTTTTTLSFTITGPNATTGFSNMTIPKTDIPYGTTPLISIDGQQATNQGYTQDANNFYIWYTTQFSTHQVKVQFTASSTLQTISFDSVLAIGVTVPEIILLYTVIAIRRLKRKPENA